MRASLLMRMGEYADAVFDFSAAVAPLKEAGEPTLECIFNKAYCHRQSRQREDLHIYLVLPNVAPFPQDATSYR